MQHSKLIHSGVEGSPFRIITIRYYYIQCVVVLSGTLETPDNVGSGVQVSLVCFPLVTEN